MNRLQQLVSSPAPFRRRWFSFSLRTLFLVLALVAAPLAWVGLQLKWIHDRSAIIDTFLDRYEFTSFDPHERDTVAAPWSVRLFGETGAQRITLGHAEDGERGEEVDPELVREFKRLYPESEIEVPYNPQAKRARNHAATH